MQHSAEELRDMLAHRDARGLRVFLEESHPGNVAESLAQLDAPEIIHALRYARKDHAIEVFEFFSEETQAAIFEGLARREMAEFLEEMAPDDRVDLVKRLKPELADSVLALVAQVDREDIRRLSSYREGTAGAIMTTDYACLPADITVAEALEQLRVQAPDRETIYYVYVVDANRKLLGLVELKDLIVARPAAQRKVSDVMERDVISVSIKDDPIEVARTISKYDLIAIPVVDIAKRLVGIVTVDDAMDLLNPEADEPSAGGSDRAAASVLGYVDRAAWATNRSRGLWLLVPAVIVGVAWLALGLNHPSLALPAVAFALPLLITFGVSPGARCSVSTARDLVRERPGFGSLLRNLADEVRFGLPPPLAILLATWLLLRFRAGTEIPGALNLLIHMGCAGVAQVVVAALLGGILAIAARALRQPPERVVAPTMLSLPDAVAMLLYFGAMFPPIASFVSSSV